MEPLQIFKLLKGVKRLSDHKDKMDRAKSGEPKKEEKVDPSNVIIFFIIAVPGILFLSFAAWLCWKAFFSNT